MRMDRYARGPRGMGEKFSRNLMIQCGQFRVKILAFEKILELVKESL